ncbi:MAG: polyprenyl diphosphate synthase [Gammaproteobacteria bacterium]
MLRRAQGEAATPEAPGAIPAVPGHVAIVMDGNGRWAQNRDLPRRSGHQAGYESVRELVRTTLGHGIKHLTLFAFSSENWSRPRSEVDALMRLFMQALRREVDELDKQGVRLDFIGCREQLSSWLQRAMTEAEAATAVNTRLVLHVAVSYGGRWDIVNGVRRLAADVAEGRLAPEQIDEAHLRDSMALARIPDPDLFIRTGGEFRISNFLLWNLAYTELYFTDTLWPDFDAAAFETALEAYAARQRRYGCVKTSTQRAHA